MSSGVTGGALLNSLEGIVDRYLYRCTMQGPDELGSEQAHSARICVTRSLAKLPTG